ncbi:hypothetical protein GOV03_00495 [Candidatus Woesearchaeota archaeon]|nr:hypothetical protein [Candidatus Woesearchaeota archaeon]
MDVDRVQKISNLAEELMKQGLVQERDEAIQQAEKILAKEDCSSLNETMEEVQGLNLETGEIKQVAEETLSLDKVKDVMEKNTTFMVKKMKEHQEEVEGLKQEIAGLRNELKEIRYTPNNLPTEPAVKEVVREEPAAPAEEKPEATGSSDENHPRSGNFNDTDVSIEKFFYSGSKPRE